MSEATCLALRFNTLSAPSLSRDFAFGAFLRRGSGSNGRTFRGGNSTFRA